MTDLLAARSQMAISLGFHIIFASIGMAMPFLMATSHYLWLRTGEERYRALTKAWTRGVAMFFATGAVSGTVLSFELGLLWPNFMKHAGAIIGMPFSWEGTAFFIEAIALGLFLYGWDKLRPWVHWWCGVLVGVSGLASAFFVIAANGWMNSPTGFDWVNGQAVNIDPVRAMFNDAFLIQSIHMTFAAFIATGFAVAGVHALILLQGGARATHLPAVRIALVWAAVFSILQPIAGDFSAKSVAKRQPEKLAAMEALFESQTQAPLLIGGIPSVDDRTVRYGIEIPGFLSFLAHGDFDAKVTGLNDFPKEDWPPVVIVHFAFQVMVAIGTLLALVSVFYLFSIRFWPKLLENKRVLRGLVILTPSGFLALESGWVVTKVGRQPWIIYKILRTSEAVTPMPGLIVPFVIFTLLYGFLTTVLFWLMVRQIRDFNEKSAEL